MIGWPRSRDPTLAPHWPRPRLLSSLSAHVLFINVATVDCGALLHWGEITIAIASLPMVTRIISNKDQVMKDVLLRVSGGRL